MFKNILILLLIVSCASKKPNIPLKERVPLWELTQGIKTPESIYFEPISQFIFVSNVDGDPTKKDNNGFISLLDKKGNVIKIDWVKTLNAPKGMRAIGNALWVTDIDKVYAFAIPSGMLLHQYSIKGAKFLNDIAILDNKTVVVSDTIGSALYILKNNKFELLHQGAELESPNGLLYHEGKLIVAAWGLTTNFTETAIGHLYEFDLKTKKKTNITPNALGNLDGLEWHKDGYFLSSDWKAGVIFKIFMNGESEVIYRGEMGLADIGYIPASNTILIPYMMNNKVLAY